MRALRTAFLPLVIAAGCSELAAQVQVSSANPNSAAQGTINLDIAVGGSGFKHGANAKWFVSGTTNPGGVTVNSTSFVSSSQLTANINVDASADISSFDIVVTNADGRTGKGTGLFSVTSPNNSGNNNGQADIPVTSFLADFDSTGAGYFIQSDGMGAYSDTNNVTSILAANGYNHITWGDWQLDMSLQTARTLRVTFSQANAVQPGDPGYTAPANPPYWGTNFAAVRMINECSLDNHDMLTMKPGDKFTCGMILRFPSQTTTFFRLEMSPTHTNETETQQVQVSCNAGDPGGCNDWFIDPIPVVNPDGTTSPGRTRARLDLVDTHGRGSLTNEGDFYMMFHFHVTRP